MAGYNYSPGPWKIIHYGWNDKGKNGDFVGVIEDVNGEDVYAGAAASHSINKLANVHLIACAPEMVETLLKIIALWEKEGDTISSVLAEMKRIIDKTVKPLVRKATLGENKVSIQIECDEFLDDLQEMQKEMQKRADGKTDITDGKTDICEPRERRRKYGSLLEAVRNNPTVDAGVRMFLQGKAPLYEALIGIILYLIDENEDLREMLNDGK